MSILAVIFGILSGCFLAVLVGIIGSHRRIGFGWAFLVLNLYSMGLSSTLARTAVRQAFGAPREEQWGELCFTDRAGKQLPLGTYYRFTR